MKTCTKCGLAKPLSDFAKDAKSRDGLHQHCLQCKREARKLWRDTHPEENKQQWLAWESANYDRHLSPNRRWQSSNREKMHRSLLMNRYGITLETYQRLLEAQNGKCKICGEAEKLVVDHKHDDTRQVRALLCVRCNSGIGFFRENVQTMLSAIAYLSLGDEYDPSIYTVNIHIAKK